MEVHPVLRLGKVRENLGLSKLPFAICDFLVIHLGLLLNFRWQIGSDRLVVALILSYCLSDLRDEALFSVSLSKCLTLHSETTAKRKQDGQNKL